MTALEPIVFVHGMPVNDGTGGEVYAHLSEIWQTADHCNEVQRRRYCPRDQRTQADADRAVAVAAFRRSVYATIRAIHFHGTK